MTSQQIFEACLFKSNVIYKNQCWHIQSTYNDGTADLTRVNRMGDLESAQAPFAQIGDGNNEIYKICSKG